MPASGVAVLLPDGPGVHAAFVGAERAGMVVVGLGHRAGDREIAHLLSLTGATTLVTEPQRRDRTAAELVTDLAALGAAVERVVLLDADGAVVDAGIPDGAPAAGSGEPLAGPDPDALFLLNSTSGTTGLPKCVMHTQNRWFYFHRLAAAAGAFAADEVFMSVIPAPFGFGLWTAHFTPAIMGCPTVVMDRFDAEEALDLIERERVTVLGCVSTQFIMMLNANAERPRDLSSLRSMFTGGEAVPFERAAAFEDVTGARVLQFYGSNETGALSHTTVHDDRHHRFATAGRVIDDMHVRLLDPETMAPVADGVQQGQPACKGPATCLGYWGDDGANQKLFTDDGWMLMGDIVEIDDAGYLTVIGRTSDFIIRGGKNISAPAVEAELATHPDVAMVAAVAFPDPVFGERGVRLRGAPAAGPPSPSRAWWPTWRRARSAASGTPSTWSWSTSCPAPRAARSPRATCARTPSAAPPSSPQRGAEGSVTGALDGRSALVTGGAHGLGQAIVRRFVAEGARVAVADIDTEAAAALAGELGAAAMAVRLDVGSESEWQEAVDTVAGAFGGLDVGVNNGGIVLHGALADTTLEDYERIVRVNQIGTFLGLRTMAEPMKAAGRGAIVNMSSIRGMVGSAGLLAYTATKFAVRGMTKGAALELGPHGIRVNSIHPGAVATRLAAGVDPEVRDRRFAGQPIARIAQPAEIAALALFLASDESSYCTGAEFVADGGQTAGPMFAHRPDD